MTASLVLLSPKQRAFIERMRHIVVPDDNISSSSELSSSDEQRLTEHKFLQWAINKIDRSENKVDKRLMSVHSANQASIKGVTFDNKGSVAIV